MKNFLCKENLKNSSQESLSEIIQSSSEMEGCPITNILESEDKTLWLSTEELPQEITINFFKLFFKEFPKKISSIGIYCWHAYPSNPKLIEVQISKNNGKTYLTLGNFDLCLKPGRQLLQLEDDSEYILSKDISNNNIIIKLIIKETFGDKRTYINNIYLYEDINIFGKNFITSMEPNKEEDSNSMIYLRESRERNLPKSNIKKKARDFIDKNYNIKDLIEIDFDTKSEDEKNKIISKKNENKFLGIESGFIMSDSELSEKYNNKDEKKENMSNIKLENKIININEELNQKVTEKNKNNNKDNVRYIVEKITNDELNYNKLNSGNEDPYDVEEKEKSLNINDFNDDEYNDNEKDLNINNNKYDNINNNQNEIENVIDEQSINSYKEEDFNLLIEEFENYKKIQKEKINNYKNKINILENQIKEMTYLNNKMNKTIKTILESQMNEKKENYDYLLNTMKRIINERVVKVFRNIPFFQNLSPFFPLAYYFDNQYNIPYNYNNFENQNFNYKLYNLNNKMNSDQKLLKTKIIPISERNKSGQKNASYKNNSIYNMVNNDINSEYNLFSRNNLVNNNYKTTEYNIENIFEDYPLKMDNNLQNYPFFSRIQQKRNYNLNHYNSSSNLNQLNEGHNNYNRLNIDNNDFKTINRAPKIKVRERFSINSNFEKINNSNNNYLNENNENGQTFKVIRNNLREIKNEKIFKPSILKSENYMKDNLTEVKHNFQIKDKIDKDGNKIINITQKKKEITESKKNNNNSIKREKREK